MKPYLLVSWDFIRTGGMDRANYALACWLADHGHQVHLVAHSVAPELAARPGVKFHRVPKIAGTYVLSEPLLDRIGRVWARRITRLGGRVLVNGGNCRWGDLNWVHYVHAAYTPTAKGGVARKLKWRWSHWHSLREEKASLINSRIVFANSEVTKDHLVSRIGIPEKRIETIYYGIDRDRFRPSTQAERAASRAALGLDEKPMLTFIGGLGDRRKGFDTVFEAWRILCRQERWDARLVVIGVGSELEYWKSRAIECGLERRIRFLGFRPDVDRVLAAADALVAPTRYEAYGLGVHEAICCGIPAFVTRTAGVAERYSKALGCFLIRDPDNAAELAERLQAWRVLKNDYMPDIRAFSERLRERTWNDMAAQMVAVAEEYA